MATVRSHNKVARPKQRFGKAMSPRKREAGLHAVTNRGAEWFMALDADVQWERFWAVYPKRMGKKDALKAWAKLKPDSVLVDNMLSALEWQMRQKSWTNDNGQYIPYPATWLRGRRWEDEPPPQIRRVMSDAAAAVFQELNK